MKDNDMDTSALSFNELCTVRYKKRELLKLY